MSKYNPKPGIQFPRPGVPYSKPPPSYNISNPASIPIKEIDRDKILQLFAVTSDGDYQKIKTIISDKNILLNVKNEKGETLLHAILHNQSTGMSEKEKYELIKYLLDHNVPVSTYDKNNITALHLACKYQYPKITNLILKYGCQPNPLDSQNMTPLHYVCQGKIYPCKQRKKVGSLIPKKAIIAKGNHGQEMKDMTLHIMDILNTKYFNMYLLNIKRTLNNINNIYIYDLEEAEVGFISGIANIIADTKATQMEKIDKVKNRIVEFGNSINSLIMGKLGQSTKPVDIGPHNIDGWGPETKVLSPEYYDKVLPKKGIGEIMDELNKNYNKDRENITKKINQKMDKLDTLMVELNTINDNIDRKLFEIDQFYGNFLANSNHIGKKYSNYIGEKYLLLESEEADTGIPYYEIDTLGKVSTDHLDFLPKNQFSSKKIEIIRGTQAEINEWRRQKRKPRALPLTVDTRIAVGPDPANINFKNIYIQHFANDTRYKQLNGFYGGNPIYFTSIFSFAITQIKKHIIYMKYNFGELFEEWDLNYYYEFYHRIMSNNYTMCFNIFQNILLAHKEKDRIVRIANQMENDFAIKFNEKSGDPYVYLYEYAKNAATEVSKLTIQGIGVLKSLYTECREIIESMNEIVKMINQNAGIQYILKYMEGEFINETIDEFSNIYNKPLRYFKLPYTNIENYIDLFSRLPLDDMRKKFYEEFAPSIDLKHYPTYLTDNQLNPAIGPFCLSPYVGIRNIMSFGCEAVYKINRVMTGSTPPETERKPQAGYLCSPPYNVTTNTQDQFPISKLKYEGYGMEDLLKPSNNIKIGRFGAIFSNDPSINRTKAGPALDSIGMSLDIFLYMIKYNLVQKVIELYNSPKMDYFDKSSVNTRINENIIKNINSDRDKLKQILRDRYVIDDQINPILFSMVGKITDELITEVIKNSVFSGTNKYAQQFLNKNTYEDYAKLLEDPILSKIPREIVFRTESGFEANLNELYENILDTFIHKPSVPPDWFNYLMHTVNVMEKEKPLKEQFQIYNPNYGLMSEITESLCYKIKPEIVDILAQFGAKVNTKDATGTTPIFYALDTLYTPLIEKLLNHQSNVNIKTVKNFSGLTPYTHFLKLYEHHNSIMTENHVTVSEILNYFCKPIYKDIKKNLESNQDFKNNVIRYLDIIFPQLILMYNNLLFFYAKSYINGWGFDQQQQFEQELLYSGLINDNQYDIPLLEGFTDEIFYYGIELDPLIDSLNVRGHNYDKIDQEIVNLKHIKTNLEKEMQNMRNKSDQYSQNILKQFEVKIIKIDQEIFKREDKSQDILKYGNNLANIVENKHPLIVSVIEQRIEEFKENRNFFVGNFEAYDNIYNTVSKTYATIFKDVIGTRGQDGATGPASTMSIYGYEDHFMYNKMWEDMIKSNDRLKSIFNIHLSSTLLQKKYIYLALRDTNNINNSFKLIKEIYNNVFVPTIKNTNYLPQDYNLTTNYALTQSLDIMAHIIKHVVCANMYYAIIKVITKYLLTLNPEELLINKENINTYKEKVEYNLFIATIVQKIVNPRYEFGESTGKSLLYSYIVNDVPKILIKFKLKIYEDDFDEARNLTSVDDIFNQIDNMLISNQTFPIPKNSSLITSLNNYVYKYYKEVFNLVIPKMKQILDNYNRFILNESEFINIAYLLAQVAQKEKII